MECKQIYNTGMRAYMSDSYNFIDFTVLSLYLASYTLRFLVDRWIKAADAFYDGTSRARISLVERNRTEYDLIMTEVFSDELQPLHSYFMKACTISHSFFVSASAARDRCFIISLHCKIRNTFPFSIKINMTLLVHETRIY